MPVLLFLFLLYFVLVMLLPLLPVRFSYFHVPTSNFHVSGARVPRHFLQSLKNAFFKPKFIPKYDKKYVFFEENYIDFEIVDTTVC